MRTVRLLDLASISVVEVAEAARTNLAAVDIVRLQRLGLEVGILARLGQHLRNASTDGADLNQVLLLVAMHVRRGQRIRAPLRLELDVRHITVVHLVVELRSRHLTAAEAQHRVLLGWLRALDIINVHDVSRLEAELLPHGRHTAGNIRHIHLVAHELGRLGMLVLDVLQVILRVERILGRSLGRELDALGHGPLDVVDLHLIVWLVVESEVELSRV